MGIKLSSIYQLKHYKTQILEYAYIRVLVIYKFRIRFLNLQVIDLNSYIIQIQMMKFIIIHYISHKELMQKINREF